MRLEQRLANLGERLGKARRDLQISEEQLAFQTDVAARSVVEELVREQDRLLERLSGKLSARGGS
jgi:hypothetical protein